MSWTIFDEVSILWAEHRESPFPDELYWADGDLWAIDAEVAACVATYVNGRGVLDSLRRRVLRRCANDLAAALPRLHGEAAVYAARMMRMTELIG